MVNHISRSAAHPSEPGSLSEADIVARVSIGYLKRATSYYCVGEERRANVWSAVKYMSGTAGPPGYISVSYIENLNILMHLPER